MRHTHNRQSHRAVIAADDAMYAIIKYPALGDRLRPFGDTLGITGDDFQPMINAIDIDAAFRVDISRRLLISPIDNHTSPGRAGR